MRIIIACGGTGGHFYPGYTLGRTLRERGHEVLFVLRRQDPAAGKLEEEDLPFAEIDLRGLPRGLSPRILVFLWKLASSLGAARRLVRAYRPAVAVGMGGYLTFPLAAAAGLADVPLVLHEANSVLGLANRVCLRWASRLALGLPQEAPPGLPARLTGTPVRPELWEPGEAGPARRELGLDPDKPTILVFGGSQGARAINQTAPEALALLAAKRPGAFQALHLSGPADEGAARAAYARTNVPSCVRAYLERMQLAYAAADLALCRAGASTLSELIALKKPALLIPFPSAAGGHQEANARVLERAGAAQVLLESALTAEELSRRVEALLLPDGAAALPGMSAAFSRLELPPPARSAQALADIVEEVATHTQVPAI